MAEGKSVQQTVEMLTRKLELLGAEKQGTFCVDCETYHTAASTMSNQGARGGHREGLGAPSWVTPKGQGAFLGIQWHPGGFASPRSALWSSLEARTRCAAEILAASGALLQVLDATAAFSASHDCFTRYAELSWGRSSWLAHCLQEIFSTVENACCGSVRPRRQPPRGAGTSLQVVRVPCASLKVLLCPLTSALSLSRHLHSQGWLRCVVSPVLRLPARTFAPQPGLVAVSMVFPRSSLRCCFQLRSSAGCLLCCGG